MCPQEPQTLSRLRKLSIQVSKERDQRACTTIGSNDRCPIRRPQGVFWIITDCTRKEASVHVQQICHTLASASSTNSFSEKKDVLTHFPNSQDNMSLHD